MPNLGQLSQPYTAPFFAERFYLIPLPWLRGVSDAGALDARELLLATVVERQVIFADGQGEQAWQREEGAVRPFFTRRTYERHRKALLTGGLLSKYQPAPCPPGVTKVAWRDLQRGIKYTATAWPGDGWVYRTRTYLENRWPVWLGNSDVASRLIVLAFFAEVGRLVQGPGAPLPEQVILNWRQISAFVEQQRDAQNSGATVAPSAALLRKGIQELLILNAVVELPDSPLRYTLSLRVFDEPPQWSVPAMAQRCKANLDRDGICLELVRDLMRHCQEPVTRLQRVWNTVQAAHRSAALLDEADVFDLQKFLRTQRRQASPPRHDHVLQAFLRQRQATGARLASDLFLLVAQEIMLASCTVDGAPLEMPATTAHGLAATQLWIRCTRSDGLTVAEAQEILAMTQLIVCQEGRHGLPTLIPLVCHKPRPLSVDFGYVLRANQLHGPLDYTRPFEVILRCRRPDARLKLHCRFRLLLARG